MEQTASVDTADKDVPSISCVTAARVGGNLVAVAGLTSGGLAVINCTRGAISQEINDAAASMGSAIRSMATLGLTMFVADSSTPEVRTWSLSAEGVRHQSDFKPFSDGAPAGIAAIRAPRATAAAAGAGAGAGATGVVAGDPLVFAAR